MDNYSKDNTKFFKKGVIFVSLGGLLINEEWRKIKNEELRIKNEEFMVNENVLFTPIHHSSFIILH